MIIRVRHFSCGKLIGDKWELFACAIKEVLKFSAKQGDVELARAKSWGGA